MSYKEHAEREFKAAGWDLENDEMQAMMCKQVMELLDLFDSHGHSGMSAPYAINLFRTLAMFKPIVPLTGADDEWREIGPDEYQNVRCSHVFKRNGQAYDIQGKVFESPSGNCYTNTDSQVPVTFPYTPKTEFVKGDPDA